MYNLATKQAFPWAIVRGDSCRSFENGKLSRVGDSSKLPERGEDVQRRLPVVFFEWFSVVIHDKFFDCLFSIFEENSL